LLVVLCLPGSAGAGASKWWQAPDVQRELHLTMQQVSAIEHVFQETLPERRTLRENLDRLDAELQHLLDAPDVDDAVIFDLIDRVEDARARRNVARTVLLLRMRRCLTPEQRAQLDRLKLAAPVS
jgi:Spy/CpxP family protein refolding chaperone